MAKLNVRPVPAAHKDPKCPATPIVGKHTKGISVTTKDGKKDCNSKK